MRERWQFLVRSGSEDGGGGGQASDPPASDPPENQGGSPASPPPPAPPAEPPWYERRLGVVTAERREAERQLAQERAEKAELQRQLAAMQGNGGGGSGTPAPPPGITQADIDRIAQEKAADLIFTDKCNSAYEAGTAEFPDFATRIQSFAQLGGIPRPVMEAVLELPEGHKVLYELSADLNEASRIFSIPNPIRQATAIASLAAKPKPRAPARASAPPPPPPPPEGRIQSGTRGSGGVVDLYSPNTPKEDWFRARAEQKKTLRGSRR